MRGLLPWRWPFGTSNAIVGAELDLCPGIAFLLYLCYRLCQLLSPKSCGHPFCWLNRLFTQPVTLSWKPRTKGDVLTVGPGVTNDLGIKGVMLCRAALSWRRYLLGPCAASRVSGPSSSWRLLTWPCSQMLHRRSSGLSQMSTARTLFIYV